MHVWKKTGFCEFVDNKGNIKSIIIKECGKCNSINGKEKNEKEGVIYART